MTIIYFILAQDDANWKQYAVHAPDVPVQKVCAIQ